MSSATGNIPYTTPAIEAFYRQHRVRWQQFYESERVVLDAEQASVISRHLLVARKKLRC